MPTLWRQRPHDSMQYSAVPTVDLHPAAAPALAPYPTAAPACLQRAGARGYARLVEPSPCRYRGAARV